MIESFTLARQIVIYLGIAAALLVTIGSWLKVKYGSEKKRIVMTINYAGYVLFFLSIAIFIIAGFST